MNLNEIRSAWNSTRNNLPTEERQRLARQFTGQMIRRRRFQAIWLVHTFIALTVITIIAIWAVVIGKAKPEEQWALLPLLTVPWLFAFQFLRRYLKPSLPSARGELSVTDSLRAALSANRAEQSRLKLVAVLFAIMIPLLLVSMKQLHAAGKVSSNELASMAVLFGGTLLLSSAGIAARYFGRLLPQHRWMNELLAELTDQTQ